MKINFLLLAGSLLLAGCQTAPVGNSPLPDPLPVHGKPANYTELPPGKTEPVNPRAPESRSSEIERLAAQKQLTEASESAPLRAL